MTEQSPAPHGPTAYVLVNATGIGIVETGREFSDEHLTARGRAHQPLSARRIARGTRYAAFTDMGANTKKRIVITGETGLIGSKLAVRLRDHGHDAVPAAPNTGLNTLAGEGFDDGAMPLAEGRLGAPLRAQEPAPANLLAMLVKDKGAPALVPVKE